MKRKLTTIFYADVQRYSALMGSDEAGTLERLRRYQGIMAQMFDRHDGRQVNTWGDAVIAEFASVVEAVRCAVEIQDAISAENRSLPKAKQMWFRIGINLGDVMIDEGNLYGDGVNVAARLETLAEPGGILVSDTVYRLAHKQLAIGFEFAGEQEVKNVDGPVTSYRVRMPDRNAPDESDAPIEPEAPSPEPETQISRTAHRVEAGLAWLRVQPRKIQIFAGLIGFFVMLNLLFGGIANPWAIFPSAPFALLIFLHYRRTRGRDQIRT